MLTCYTIMCLIKQVHLRQSSENKIKKDSWGKKIHYRVHMVWVKIASLFNPQYFLHSVVICAKCGGK